MPFQQYTLMPFEQLRMKMQDCEEDVQDKMPSNTNGGVSDLFGRNDR